MTTSNERSTRLAENKAVALRFLDVYSRLDTEGSLSLMTADAVFDMFGNHARLDAAGIAEHLEKARRITRDIHQEVKEVVAEEDYVVVHTALRATTANGKPYNGAYLWLLRIRDGKVAYVCEYANLLAAIEAFGIQDIGEPTHAMG
jgi:ketosteroid isomerase-like protein